QHKTNPPASKHFRCQGNNLHELIATQLAGNRSEDAGTDRLTLIVKKHGRVLVETNQRSILASYALTGSHYNSIHDVALLNLAARNRFLDRHLDHIADACITT